MSELALQLIEKEKQEKTGKLDLGNCGLKDIPEELFELTWLEELFFSNAIWDNNKKTWINSSNSGGENCIYIAELPTGFRNLAKLKKLYFGGQYRKKWRLNRCDILSCLGNIQSLYLRYNEISDYSFLEKLTGLQSLDLSANQISDISFLEQLSSLQFLDLRHNQISDISFLEKLIGLQSLLLGANQISDISFLEKLSSLQSLDLSASHTSDYSFLEKLTGLQFLDLRHNKISDISFLEKLIGLQSLLLGANQISDINFLEKLTGLQALDLGANQISDISFLEKLTGLQALNLSSNEISDYSFLEKLTSLQSLDLRASHTSDYSFLEKLTSLQSLDLRASHTSDYSFLEKLTSLQSLDLRHNRISDISFLEKLTGLQALLLGDNEISDINFLEKLTGLQSLNLSYNKISEISFLEKLTSLQFLDLIGNEISEISFLEKLTGLQSLGLSYNKISDISFLEKLIGLQSLDLSYNKISDIKPLLPLIKWGAPVSTEFLGTGIKIHNNPISTPPMSIVEKGREAVLNWFEQIEEGEKPLFETKLMILGQGEAGKTSLANLLLDPDYIVKEGKIKSTLGIDVHKGEKEFQHQNMNHQKIKAHLWDFGGQDIQKMLHQFFITENCLYVLVSDKRAENTNFDYWFQIINLLGPQSSVIVLENPRNIDSATKDFPLTKYRELFKELTIEGIEVNLQNTRSKAKTKWRLLNEIIEEKLSGLEIVNRRVPQKWALVRNELEKLQEKKYINKDTFYQICSKPDIGMTHKQADLCLFYLRELGDLAYFDDRDLCTHIFLDHNWLTEGMYYILSDKQIQDKKGRFTREQAYRKWDSKGYNEEEKAMLLRLLLKDKFDICYELKHEKDVFITPLLLPSDKPDKWEWETNLYFRYQYGFIPHGMFSRLIVRIHEKIDTEQRWETGVRLIDSFNGDTVRAEVQQYTDPDENQRVIDIRINGRKEGCKRLLTFVRSAIENLHKDFRNIKFKRIVACNCDTCISLIKEGEKPSFYDYEKLQSKIKSERYSEDCGKSNYKRVNIGKILSDVVIENATSGNPDSDFLYKLNDKGVSINQIKNEIKIEMSEFGKASAFSTATANAEATNTVSIEIQNIFDETEILKEDIERELKIKKVPEEEIKLAKSDVEVFENALKKIETANNNKQEPPEKSKNRLKRFWEDLSNEKSSLYNSLKLLRKGKDYGVKIAEAYNKIAENTGMPSVPPLALDVIKKL